MREIPLTQGRVALVNDGDYEFLMTFRWRFHDVKEVLKAVGQGPGWDLDSQCEFEAIYHEAEKKLSTRSERNFLHDVEGNDLQEQAWLAAGQWWVAQKK